MIGTITLNPSLDQYLRVPHLTKDDAIRAASADRFAGGKGVNVSRVVHELGGSSCAYGLVGGLPGQMLTMRLDAADIPHAFCQLSGPADTADTRINTTITDLSDQTQTHIRMPGPTITADDVACLKQHLSNVNPAQSFWVLGGSLPPGAPAQLYAELITQLQATGVRCVLDTDDEALVHGLNAAPFLIKPNEHEFERLTGQVLGSDADIVTAARAFVEQGVGVVLVSLGPRGAIVVSQDDVFGLHTPHVEVRSKVGAGDSAVAGCLVALERGDTLRDAMRYAMAAGTAAVLTEGTKLCHREDVERLLPHITLRSL